MSSISIRFALASVSVALFILALSGIINYIFIKKELLIDANEKAQLIVKNSKFQIDTLIQHTSDQSKQVKRRLQQSDFSPSTIQTILTQTLKDNNSFFGMTVALEPQVIVKEPYSPYYYKRNNKIAYANLASNTYNYLKHPWYTQAKYQARWSQPYFDKGGGNVLMATYSNPLKYHSQFAGVVTIDITLEWLQKLISDIHILDSGYAFLLSKDNAILVHPDPSKIMQKYSISSFKYNQIIKEKNHWIYYATMGETKFILAIVLPSNELFASLHQMSLISIVLAIVGSILLIITMILISRRISAPLEHVVTLTDDISRGHFDTKIALPKNKDEIYRLSLSVNRMQKAIKNYIEDLKNATIKEERIESELSIARSIQMSMLPQKRFSFKSISIYASLQPAKAVGGDFYDFFTLGDNHLCFVIADVSGKGVPAALYMSVTISYIRAYAKTTTDPSTIVSTLNDTLASNNNANMFVTLFLGIINLKNRELHYVNAGHNNPYIITSKIDAALLISSGDCVVGAFEGLAYHSHKRSLQSNDKLFLYTDGVTEAFAKDGEAFGDKRLQKVLTSSQSLSNEEILNAVMRSLEDFCKNYEQSDDITLLAIEF